MKYTLLELILSDHAQWVRKLSKAYWAKKNEPGYKWVRYDKDELEKFPDLLCLPSPEYTIENWTGNHQRSAIK